MADTATADTGLLPRTYFRAPRVPLDLRALFLALIGYAVFRAGSWLLWKIFDPTDPVTTFFEQILSVVRIPYIQTEFHAFVNSTFLGGGHAGQPGGFWAALLGGAYVFVVWGFFGQAIHRITALRIARDEGMPMRDALKFAGKNFTTILLCPVIVAGAIGLFYGCNALAGLVISIPFAGSILSVILLPLATISTLLILLIAIGGAIGMPLVAAAAAWERNGSLDAISRAFSYVFARPLQFFWNYFLIFLFTSVILIAGEHFVHILTGSVDAGMLNEKTSMIIDTPEPGSKAYDKYDNDTKTAYGKLADRDKAGAVHPYALSFSSLGEAPAAQWLTVLVCVILLNVIVFGISATALWWFFGATTSTYADLRSDVDGTEEDEIYLEEEEQDFEALAKPPEASAAAAPPPPAEPPPPAPEATPPTA